MFVDVRLLGPLQVLGRSAKASRSRARCRKALLAVLALASPTPVSSDRIVDALWGEEPPDSHPASPHSTVSRGEVYVTHPFAALSGDISIACQYVGTLPTAKGYGSLPLYALHQKV